MVKSADSIVQGMRIRVVPMSIVHATWVPGGGTYACARFLYTVPMM